MKALSIIGFIAAILGLLVALYNQFVVIPALDIADMNLSGPAVSQFQRDLFSTIWQQLLDAKINNGITGLAIGLLGLILLTFPIIKTKKAFPIIGGIIALIACVLGLLQGMA